MNWKAFKAKKRKKNFEKYLTLAIAWVYHSTKLLLKDVRAHCYCAYLVRTLFIRHACATSFSRACTESKTQQNIQLMTFALTLVCEYFCWMFCDPHFFFGRSLPFLILSIILRNKKNLYVGSFNYFSYAIHIGSTWYMDTGVRDLEVVFFKATSTWFNDIRGKELSNRPI